MNAESCHERIDQREAAIFDAALLLPFDKRANYLNHACRNDAALGQRVEALLKACDRTTDFLDELVDTDPRG